MVWVCDASVPEFGQFEPDATLRAPILPHVLDRAAKLLLGEERWNPDLVDRVIDEAVSVFGSYDTTITPTDLCLRANDTPLMPMTAIVAFQAENARGHLLISASASQLAGVAITALPWVEEASIAEITELAAELVTRMMQGLTAQLGAVTLTPALLVDGRDVVLRGLTQPSLVACFEAPLGDIYLELAFAGERTALLSREKEGVPDRHPPIRRRRPA